MIRDPAKRKPRRFDLVENVPGQSCRDRFPPIIVRRDPLELTRKNTEQKPEVSLAQNAWRTRFVGRAGPSNSAGASIPFTRGSYKPIESKCETYTTGQSGGENEEASGVGRRRQGRRAKRGTRGICRRRFDGIVKINERIPGSSKMSRASIFLARRPTICNGGDAFSETMRHPECARVPCAKSARPCWCSAHYERETGREIG